MFEILNWFLSGDAEICACPCTCGCTCPGSVIYSDDVKSTKKWQTTQTDASFIR